ncbi:MAG: hydantoinase/oxoprolinase family protein, partial [Alphaproteobacteria bacterium]
VGPRSAGAEPGPACYGFGGREPTVTDANLLLGRLGWDRFLGGEMKLDVAAARQAMEAAVCRPLGLDVTEAAEGILRIAAASMAHVVRRVTTDRGLDAADFAMIAYGGAGPLHAAMVAKELRMAKVVIPHSPGHFSAFGMLASDYRRDYVRTWFTPLAAAAFADFERFYGGMEEEGRASIARASEAPGAVFARRQADMRYVGQEHAVTVDLPAALFDAEDREGIKRAFDAAHRVNYGYADDHVPAEIVSLRVSVVGEMAKPPRERRQHGPAEPDAAARRGARPVYFREAGGFVETPVYDRPGLAAGNRIAGPALVEEYASTTVVQPGDRLTVDAYGDLVIEIGRS